MTQKRKITDYLSVSASSGSVVRESAEGGVGPTPAKHGKHRDSYDPKWEEDFTWLRYIHADQEDGPSMLCTLCKKHNKSSKRMVWLTIPCKLFRKNKVREHERSQCHIDAVKAEAIAVAARCSGGIRSCIEEQISLQWQAVRGAFKCVYWHAKQEIAHHTKFRSLIELGKSLGCSYFNELKVGKNANYMSYRMINEFPVVLSDWVEKDILCKLRASPAVGILCDESTDVANLKQLVVFVRFLVEGKSHNSFLKIVDLANGTAETIERALLDICSQCEIPTSQIFGFGSDGASVMTGKHTGVATRLKVHNPEIISLHCGAHRLGLASSQAAEGVAYLKTFGTHLVTLYYHFANSPVREAALHEIQEIMEEPVLHLKRAIHTRWLSHDQAVASIQRTLPSLLTTLEREAAEKDDAVARGLLQALKCYKFVATLFLLSDVLPLLSKLSLIFQKEDIDLGIIKPVVSSTIASIKLLRDKPGVYLKQLDEAVHKLTTDFRLKVSCSSKADFQSVREAYIDKLVSNLEEWFAESDLLGSLVTLFHPGNASESKQSSPDNFDTYMYGDTAINTVATKFTTTVTKERLQLEWMGFQHNIILSSEFANARLDNVMATLSGDTTFSSLYPTLSKLTSIAFTLPISTANCERGTMNRIKTDS